MGDSGRPHRICVAYFVTVLLSFGLALTQIDSRLFPGDFVSFYGVGEILKRGEGQDLFDIQLQARVQSDLLLATQRNPNDVVIKFFYPPAFGWLYVPFTFIPLIPAYFMWWAFCTALLILAVHLIKRATGGRPAWGQPTIVLGSLSFFPVLECLLQGQTSFVVLILLATLYYLLKTGRPGMAGFVLGLAFIKPQLVIVLVIFLASRGCGQVLLGWIGGGVVLTLSSWLTSGTQALVSYPSNASSLLRDPLLRVDAMTNIRGSVYRVNSWMGGDLSAQTMTSLSLALAALILMGMGWHWWRTAIVTSRQFDLGLAQALFVGLLVTPHLFDYDLITAALPVLLVAASLPAGTPAMRAWISGVLFIHTCAFVLSSLPIDRRPMFQIVTLGIVAAAVWAGRLRRG